MLNKQEELFIKQMVELRYQKVKALQLTKTYTDMADEYIDNVMNGFGYPMGSVDDVKDILTVKKYSDEREKYQEDILVMLPQQLQDKVEDENIDLVDYGDECVNKHAKEFTVGGDKVIAYTFLERTGQLVDSVEEANKLTIPDPHFIKNPTSKKQMKLDKKVKSLTNCK